MKSLERRFESSLFDIKQLAQADLFDSEIESAKELNKQGFSRAAGAVCGVLLEKQVCQNHLVTLTKKRPTLVDYYQLLKENDVIDLSTWRFIQHLCDIRNICDHHTDNEPTKEQVTEFINGTNKIIKTVF